MDRAARLGHREPRGVGDPVRGGLGLDANIGRPLLRREIRRMWEGFAESMASDLAPRV